MFTQASALLALAASASAHMVMEYPVPYGKDTLNNSPLAPGDFPCKQRAGAFEVSEMNQWNAGETKDISFKGSAVHGGGSCQFSITTDMEPSTSTQWKVIHSVIGGCPSNVTGNLPDNSPDGHGAAVFPVTMPEDVPAGKYSFAWTWLNKVGNREFYMNCAPVEVGGGSGTASAKDASSALSSLPDMFVANLPDTSCSTSENQDFNYPDPGKSVSGGNGPDIGDTLNGAGCASMTAMGAGSGQMGSPSQETGAPSTPQASEQPAVTSAPVESAAPSAAPSNPGGVFAPGASSGAAANPTSVAAPNPTSVAAPAPPASTGGSAPSSGDCTSCDQDGAVVCIGSTQFGLCNRGCAVAQDLAAGMTCANGAITRRSVRFPRGHLHRRHGSQMI